MAHLRDLPKCMLCKAKPAVVELRGIRNESYGVFCRPCGEKRLVVIKQVEEDERELLRKA